MSGKGLINNIAVFSYFNIIAQICWDNLDFERPRLNFTTKYYIHQNFANLFLISCICDIISL